MHIPDGYLKPEIWVAFDLISVPAVGYLSRKVQRMEDNPGIPLLGVMGAFVFAAQMINFPVGLGATGHLLGGALLAATLGPASASLVLAVIIGIQALVFQDGGLLAWGANTFNMAFCGTAAGYLPYWFLGRGRLRAAGLFLGGVLSVFSGAMLALLMLKLSGQPVGATIFGGSALVFLTIGVVEGAITVAVFEAVQRLKPASAALPGRGPFAAKRIVLAGAIVLILVGVPLASPLPDALEKAAASMGIEGSQIHLMASPLAGYELAPVRNGYLRKTVAALIGVGLVYATCLMLSRSLTRRRTHGMGSP